MFSPPPKPPRPPAAGQASVWPVGALCLAVADALQARFNPVAVEGEISGLTRAGSGHLYFSLKDERGQLRCAMFRRAASLLDFTPREGDKVVARGRLTVYEPRGELQLVVESLRQAGQGNLYEQFLRLKNVLEQEGLFDAARKRQPVAMPRGIALVTSRNAAALHDVLTALRRRAPHVPVLLVPALVQGAEAPASLRAALQWLYAGIAAETLRRADGSALRVDTILLVRGGGSIEDLWAFNDAALARLIVQSPVPLIAGIGHETDFTMADFCADLRAPTPTAAAELAAQDGRQALQVCQHWQDRLEQVFDRLLQAEQQRLRRAAQALARPSILLARHEAALAGLAQSLRLQTRLQLRRHDQQQDNLQRQWSRSTRTALERLQQRLARAALRMEMLDPQRVLERGYAILSTGQGEAVRDAATVARGERLRARVAKGELELEVRDTDGLPPELF
nr:exodeoxyribonuclease VII large subunit [Corticibacter populi]